MRKHRYTLTRIFRQGIRLNFWNAIQNGKNYSPPYKPDSAVSSIHDTESFQHELMEDSCGF